MTRNRRIAYFAQCALLLITMGGETSATEAQLFERFDSAFWDSCSCTAEQFTAAITALEEIGKIEIVGTDDSGASLYGHGKPAPWPHTMGM